MHVGKHSACECPCHACGAETCAGCAQMHGGKGAVDPVEMGVVMWKQAFHSAMMEVQAEKLKKRIEAAWGPMMDKVADAAVESMSKLWQSMLQQAGSEQEFREKLAKIWSEAGRK